jgi:molybdopterin converting factor small subunit
VRGAPATSVSVVKLVFLARLRESFGASHERFAIDAPTTVGAIRASLYARG